MNSNSMIVLNAGHRERQALLHWWHCLSDVYTNVGPFHEALKVAVYDAHLDNITWADRGTLTIQEINAMERRVK